MTDLIRGGEIPSGFKPIEFKNGFKDEDRQAILRNVEYSCSLDLPVVRDFYPEKQETLCIVGAGPSLSGQMDTIKGLDDSHYILAANQAHDYLVDNDVSPWGFIYTEIHPWDEAMAQKEVDGCRYFIASHCAKPIFDHLEGRNIILWHCFQDVGEEEIIANSPSSGLMIWGGGTPTLRAFNLALVLGFKKIKLFGVDACYSDKSHALYQSGEFREDWDQSKGIEVYCAGRKFMTQPYLARQAEEFTKFMKMHGHLFTLETYGDGLIQHIHQTLKKSNLCN